MRNDVIKLGLRGIIIVQASRYKIQELIDTQGAVSTYQALDTLSNETVLYYQYLAEPINNASHILSDYIPDILNMHYKSGMTHVITVSPAKKQHLKQRLSSSQLEQFLLDTSQALEDASDAGVIHGDIRPERMVFDDPKYLIEGYGVRWEFLPSRYSAPEKKQSVAGDVYSWAKTVGAFVPFSIPRVLANLLESCLSPDPKDRPLPEDIVDAISSFYLESSKSPQHPTLVNLRQDIADAQPDLLDNLFNKGNSEILTTTQERFVKAMDALKQPQPIVKAKEVKDVSEKRVEDSVSVEGSVVVEGSVHVEGTDTSEKLSSADLAGGNLTDLAELRDSRADVSRVSSDTEANNIGEVSSSARITDTKPINNQSISNESALLDSPTETVESTPITTNLDTVTTNLDTIDQGLAIIANANSQTSSASNTSEENPFLVNDDFADLVTQVETVETAETVETPDLALDSELGLDSDIPDLEIPDLQSADADIPNIDIPDLHVEALELTGIETDIETGMEATDVDIEVASADSEVIITDNFATQERSVEFADAEITGLDAIEHKPTFHDLTEEQIEVVELHTTQTSENTGLENTSLEITEPASLKIDSPKTEFDLADDVDESVLDDILQDIPQKNVIQKTGPANEISNTSETREDLESQAIENFFPDIPEEVDTGTKFDVSSLDFSGAGFDEKMSASTSSNNSSEDTATNQESSKTPASSNGFDATVFDTTSFDSKVTAYGTTITEEDTIGFESAPEPENTLKSNETPLLPEEATPEKSEELELTEPNQEGQEPASNFPIGDLDFDAFGADKSQTGNSDNFEDEEQEHLAALQEALAESQKTTGDFLDLKQTIDNNKLMPNSTQLERAFAALSNTVFDASSEDDNSYTEVQGLQANHQDLKLTAALSEFEDTSIEETSEQILQSSSNLADAEEIFDNLPAAETHDITTSDEVQLEIPDTSIDLPISLDSEADLLEADLLEPDLLEPDLEVVSEADLDPILTTTQEDLSLVDTNFSELHVAEDSAEISFITDTSLQDEEDISVLKDTHNLIALDDTQFGSMPEEISTEHIKPETDKSAASDLDINKLETPKLDTAKLETQATETKVEPSFEAFVDDVQAISKPKPQNEVSFANFVDVVDDLDEEASQAYTSPSTTKRQTATPQATTLENTTPVKETLELLVVDEHELEQNLVQGLDKQDLNKQDLNKQGLEQNLAEKASAPAMSVSDVMSEQAVQNKQDDLDDFLGDVLDNNNKSVQTQSTDPNSSNSASAPNPSETLFPMYSGGETLFANDTIRLEPNTKLSTDTASLDHLNESTNDTGIFSHTEFDQPAILPNDDDDDLQVIQLTDFGTPSEDTSATPQASEAQQAPKASQVEQAQQAPQASDAPKKDISAARAARIAKRAKRRAEAAEEDIDVFKTAFGKIEQMQAVVQEPQNPNKKQNTAASETAPVADNNKLDDGKLTAFEAKHQTIAEKIAAKKAQSLADFEYKKTQHDQQDVKKTIIGRSSRNINQAEDNFGEDNYDAIGKTSATVPAKSDSKSSSKAGSKSSAKSTSKIASKPKAKPSSKSSSKSAAKAKAARTQVDELSPKLTYFETPSLLEDEGSTEAPKAKKPKRKGLFQKNKPKQKAQTKGKQKASKVQAQQATDFDSGDFNSGDMAITAERQAEFNEAIGVSPLRNAWRITAASLVLAGSGAIVFLALPGLKNVQDTYVEQSVTRETQNILGLNGEHIVFTEVKPESIQQRISVIVVESPVGSKYPEGHEFHIFPNSPLSLDVEGKWQLQARYQNRTLSNTIPFEVPVLGGEPLVFSFNL